MFQVRRPLTSTFEHVWTKDPAVDLDHPDSDPNKYLETGEAKYLTFREGETPTIWILRPLSRRAFNHVMESASASQFTARDLAVAYGLREIKNGGDVSLQFEKNGHGGERIKDSCLDEIFNAVVFDEISGRILRMSTLSPLHERG